MHGFWIFHNVLEKKIKVWTHRKNESLKTKYAVTTTNISVFFAFTFPSTADEEWPGAAPIGKSSPNSAVPSVYAIFGLFHLLLAWDGCSVICRNCCGEKHLSHSFRLDYGEYDSWGTLQWRQSYNQKSITKHIPDKSITEKGKKRFIHTEINLAPIQARLGDGNGSNRRPTPYTATAKKWRTKLKGRGFNPESRETGPVENTPPRLR